LKWVAAGFPVWTAFTPTVTAQSGSITTYTASGRYSLSGKVCAVTYVIDLTTVGTAAGTMVVTVPFQAKNATVPYVGSAHENNNSGKGGYANLFANATTLNSRDSAFQTWFSNGNKVGISLVYEVA